MRHIRLLIGGLLILTATVSCSDRPTEDGRRVIEVDEPSDRDAEDAADAGAIDAARETEPTDAGDVGEPAPAPDDLNELLEEMRSEAGWPSLSAVVFDGEGIVAHGAVGVRRAGDPTEVTVDDRHHLGSCTKSMTAALAARMIEEGLIEWETPVTAVFPDFDVDPELADVTLVELLSNTAGMPGSLARDRPDLWEMMWTSDRPLTEQRHEVARQLLEGEPWQPVGTYEYSNAGFIVAGAILEAVGASSWEELMRTRLHQPLGMDSCGYGPAATPPDGVDAPWGHRLTEGEPEPVAPGPQADNPPALGPAGTVHCSLPDWAKFVRIAFGESDVLSDASVERLLEVRAPAASYALGWGVVERDWADGVAINHSGSNTMNYAVVWAAPSKRLGVLVATNIAYDAVPAEIDQVVSTLIGEYF